MSSATSSLKGCSFSTHRHTGSFMYTRAPRPGGERRRPPPGVDDTRSTRTCLFRLRDNSPHSGASCCDAVVRPATARILRMRRTLAAGIELDDDPTRVDIDAVHDFLANHSYWAEGRNRDTVERLVREAHRVVGLYDGERQVGFARAFTDGTALVYLADVYVLPEYRGRGLGVELVGEMVERGPYAQLRWILHTLDAHAFYARFGFARPS